MQERALRVRNTTNLFRNAGISWRQKLRLCVGLPAVSCLQAVVFDRRQYQIRYLQLCHCRPLCLTAVTIECATWSCVTAGRFVWPQSLSNTQPEVVSLQAVLFDRSHYRIRYLQLCHCRPFCLTAGSIKYAICSCITAGRCVRLQSLSNKLRAGACLQSTVFDYTHYELNCNVTSLKRHNSARNFNPETYQRNIHIMLFIKIVDAYLESHTQHTKYIFWPEWKRHMNETGYCITVK